MVLTAPRDLDIDEKGDRKSATILLRTTIGNGIKTIAFLLYHASSFSARPSPARPPSCPVVHWLFPGRFDVDIIKSSAGGAEQVAEARICGLTVCGDVLKRMRQ